MKTKLIIIFVFISSFTLAQNGTKTIESTLNTLGKNEHASYFEVTKEMFKMLSESKNANPQFKAYVSKLHQLKLLQARGENKNEMGIHFYTAFLQQTNLKDYSRLLTKKEGNDMLSFFKKEGKSENEFLLVSTDMIIYITGILELNSIGEFEQVMEIAGSAFDM